MRFFAPRILEHEPITKYVHDQQDLFKFSPKFLKVPISNHSCPTSFHLTIRAQMVHVAYLEGFKNALSF